MDADNTSTAMPNLSPIIEVELTSTISLAHWQNDVPVLRRLRVRADAQRSMQHLVLRLRSTPAVLLPRSWHLDALSGGDALDVTDLDVAMAPAALAGLAEATSVQVQFVLERAAGEVVASLDAELVALGAHQWSGGTDAPALLAAFVHPADDAVQRIVRRATASLAQSGRSLRTAEAVFGPKNIWRAAQAVWTSVAGEKLVNAPLPDPPSPHGQDVRPARHVVELGRASCLESTVLLAAALEAMGLRPVAVLVRGHACLALWLTDGRFASPVVRDLAQLRSRVFAPRDLMVVETTRVLGHHPSTLREAAEHAEAGLRQLRPEDFVAAVDVAGCRERGIRPLDAVEAAAGAEADGRASGRQASAAPHRGAGRRTQGGRRATADADADAEGPAGLDALAPHPEAEAAARPTVRADRAHRDVRLAQLQAELLELSMRNPLLNLKPGTKAIRLVTPQLAPLVDALAQRRRFALAPMPEPVAAGAGVGAARDLQRASQREEQTALQAFAQGALQMRAPAKEALAQLTKLYRARAQLQEEGDANTLYLAFGCLRWKRDKEGGTHVAPLLLVPARLVRGALDDAFAVEAAQDEQVRFNPTLLELLRRDYRITLPLEEDDLPRNAVGYDVDAVLRAVGAATRDRAGWEVTFDCHLALLSFSRFLLWRDLKEHAASLERNAVVAHLLSRPLAPFPSPAAGIEATALDEAISAEQMLCPLPTDSSQLVAIQAARRGESFVLIGPPGTGKSQTIANLIVQCLAERKRVLFVSAKAAALDVVYRRLRELGLHTLCLSMHEHEGGRGKVMEQIEAAWARFLATPANPRPAHAEAAWAAQVARWDEARRRLRDYAAAVHAPGANGWTPEAAVGAFAAARTAPRVDLHWASPDAHDAAALQQLDDLAQRLGLAAKDAHDLFDSPLAAIAQPHYSSSWERTLAAQARAAADAARALDAQLAALAALLPLPRQNLAAVAPLAALCAHLLAHAPRLRLLGHRDWAGAVRALQGASEPLARLRAGTDAVPPAWPEATCRQLRDALDEVLAVRATRARLQADYPGLAVAQGPTDLTPAAAPPLDASPGSSIA